MVNVETWRTCIPMRVSLDGGRRGDIPPGKKMLILHYTNGLVLIRAIDGGHGMAVRESDLFRCAERLGV
jgi:hypothetical protein